MPRVELYRALVMLECKVHLLQVAIRIAQVIVQIRAVRIAQRRLMEALYGLAPVFLFHRRFAGSVVGIACRGVGRVFGGSFHVSGLTVQRGMPSPAALPSYRNR